MYTICHLGAPPGQSVEEEGAVEGIQEWQQPQGLPARGGQLAPLQLVQQVCFKHYIQTHIYSLLTLNKKTKKSIFGTGVNWSLWVI